jgi:hypothetical protein
VKGIIYEMMQDPGLHSLLIIGDNDEECLVSTSVWDREDTDDVGAASVPISPQGHLLSLVILST